MKKALYWLTIVVLFLSVGLVANAADYTTLRKFLSARMYGEAYNELLRQEISSNEIDPKLQKLKVDLLDRTAEKLEKQVRLNPDDSGAYTILADISFQRGDFDKASSYASQAIQSRGTAMANYVFAKILFRKGNVSQAFDQMGKVLEAMPESQVVFDDFQFLYSCKQYGVATARKLTKNCNFTVRATPVAYNGDDNSVPESPFENDPTMTAGAPDFSNYDAYSHEPDMTQIDPSAIETPDMDEDMAFLTGAKDDEPASKVEKRPTPEVSNKPKKQEPLPDETGDVDEDDFAFDSMDSETISEKAEADNSSTEKEEPEEEVDPELAKREKAEKLLASARSKFSQKNYDDALANIREINKIWPDLEGKEELEKKINYKFDLKKRFDEAKLLYQDGDYDRALKVFKEAYNDDPEEYHDALPCIPQCYLLKKEPDKGAALKYLDMVLEDDSFIDELKRDLRWTKFEIKYENEEYEEAAEIFDWFSENEEKFIKEQSEYRTYYYGLWYHANKQWFWIGLGIIIVLILGVFVLQFLPDLANFGGDPLASAQKALAAKNYEKAIKYGEKGLVKKQPIQRDRQLREVLVEAYFAREQYEPCQKHAKEILKSFPENNIAWAYLAKSSQALKDTSNEAISMYEDIYRSDPSRKDLLPLIAHHYAKTQNTTPAAMELLRDYYQIAPDDKEVILALADGYVKNRTMTEDIIPVLENAIACKDRMEFRELLARTFSKVGMFEEAARESLNVLERNINNIGIQLVYISSMRKMKRLKEVIEQYKQFLAANPGNKQLIESLEDLKKEAGDMSTLVDDVPKMSDELGMPGMDGSDGSLSGIGMPGDNITDEDVANFVEPPPEGFEDETVEAPQTPLPQFIVEQQQSEQNNSIELPTLPDDIQTLNPFAEDGDELFDGFDTELPEELGGTARPPVDASKSLGSLIDDFNSENPLNKANDSFATASTRTGIPDAAPKSSILAVGAKIEEAKEFAFAKKWDEVIEVLSPEFASQRNREAGMLLIDAWLNKKQPQMALEIIQTLDFDPEMMSESIKDVLYRTAMALESEKKFAEALKLYDSICNADINYKDAFDRSDKLYAKMKA